MAYFLTVIGGLAFGAADQYLGSRSSAGPWTVAVSQMSALWLLLGFVAGMTQDRARRAMVLGLIVTLPALLGYFVMTCSPVENVPLQRFSMCLHNVAFTGYNPLWIAGGIIFGPLFGLLGHRWRVARSWVAAVVVTATLCLEPLAQSLMGQPVHAPLVGKAEVLIGVVAAIYFAISVASFRRSGEPIPRPG